MKQGMRRAVIGCLLFVASLAANATTVERVSISTPDGPRSYLIARAIQKSDAPRPLIIVLHGHGGSASQALAQNNRPSPLSMWLPIIEREGLVLVALDGAIGNDGRQGWNDCRADTASNPGTDDVAFTRSVIQSLPGIDLSRIYVMGMSNGGMMSYRLALELDPPVTAFAAASALMADKNRCVGNAHPVSALLIAGTADPLVPYQGGAVGFRTGHDRGTVISAEKTTAFWRHANGLNDPASTEQLPHLDAAHDATKASRIVYGRAPDGLQVELIRIDGGGHVEPSLTQHYASFYERLVGPQNRDLESAEEAWRFFKDKRTPPRQ